MIEGHVNRNLEARVSVQVHGSAEQAVEISAIIATGFNGFLTLPPDVMAKLALEWLYRQGGELADGTMQVFDVFEATVEWDGQPRTIEVEAVDAEPLVGMALMAGHELRIEVRADRPIKITRMA